MASATLKPPPKFVQNEWAWAYTLNKLRDKDLLDEGGNPKNYAAASAIYKRVDAKYGNPEEGREFVPRELSRSELLACDGAVWVVARGQMFAANEEAHMVVRYHEEFDGWHVERHTDEGVIDGRFDQGVAEWLVRDTPAALEFVRKQSGVVAA